MPKKKTTPKKTAKKVSRKASKKKVEKKAQPKTTRDDLEEILVSLGLHPDTDIAVALEYIDSLRREARESADTHAELKQAREEIVKLEALTRDLTHRLDQANRAVGNLGGNTVY